MDTQGHLRLTGKALKHWLIAQAQDAAAVGSLWMIGLFFLGVPLWWLWAFLGALFQFVPHLGPVLTLIGPSLALLFAEGASWMDFIYLLVLYAVIALLDGFVFQPLFMKRTARVPIWASLLTPIVLGIIFPFWGVLLAAPLLAVFYAYRAHSFPGAKSAGSEAERDEAGGTQML